MNRDDVIRQVSSFLEASRQRPRPIRVFDALLREIDRGRDHLRAWDALRDVVYTHTALADLATSFFILGGVAHIEAATLHATKLTDRQPDSANFTYLLNLIDDSKNKPFLREDWLLSGKDALVLARARLRQIDRTVTRLKVRRDRGIAHLDRREIDISPDRQAVEATDLQEVFDTADAIASDLAEAFRAFAGLPRFSIHDVSPDGLNDLIYFTKHAFEDENLESPSVRCETIREWDRHMRQAMAQLPAGWSEPTDGD